ncbi:7163_t:CDS:1, partial [Entrophospora sp. SA101]
SVTSEQIENTSDNASSAPVEWVEPRVSDLTKSLEDKKIDDFLDLKEKERVSNMMERNREKNIQHTISSEINSTTEIFQDTINQDQKTIQLESQTFAESEQITINQIQDTIPSEIAKIPYNQKVEQGLRDEFSVCVKSDNSVFDIHIPEFSLEAIIRGSGKVTSQTIVDLFNIAMETIQKEILCWYCYYKAYEDRIEDVRCINNIGDQSARTLVYNEIKLLLPDITNVNLRQRTFKAKKIYTLFMGIGIDRIRQVTYGANAISSLKDDQIQNIINRFPKKSTNTDDAVNCQKVTETSESNSLSFDLENEILLLSIL